MNIVEGNNSVHLFYYFKAIVGNLLVIQRLPGE